jgi:hypothetical protein
MVTVSGGINSKCKIQNANGTRIAAALLTLVATFTPLPRTT